MPVCTKCKIYKSSDNFRKAKNKLNNLESQCIKCRNFWSTEYAKMKRKTDPMWVLRRNEVARNSRKNNPERYKGYDLKKTPEQHFKWSLKANYGISLDEYNQMLKIQEGVCKICGKKDLRIDKRGQVVKLAVDHCHKTGKVRGLLCSSCNGGLGLFRDDINLLEKSIIYLKSIIN